MNNTRRKAIKQTIDRFCSIRKKLEELVSEVESVKSDVEDIQWEEEEYRDNMPENLQGSERYDKADEACTNLSDAVDALDDMIGVLDFDHLSGGSDGMINTTNPLRRNAWAVFLYRGKQVYSYLLRNSNLGDKERMVELLARRYMTEPENIVVDIEFRD